MSALDHAIIAAFLIVGINTAYQLVSIVARPIAIMCGTRVVRRRKS